MPLGKSRLARSKKGFYTATPLVGGVLFLTAAVLAVTIASENNAKIFSSRSADAQGKLQFIAEAMMADSYDVLLQVKLETLTSDFLRTDYFDINTHETDWHQSMRGNLESYYTTNLGDALGLDITAYSQAYSDMPGVDYCEREEVSDYISTPAIEDSGQNDGTIMVKSYSFGERIHCIATDPEGDVRVDISGRYYKVNVRVPNLYDIARWAISTAKGAINSGVSGIEEPVAKWESPRWVVVNKADNKLAVPGEVQIEGLIDNWKSLMTNWFPNRVKSVADAHAREQGYLGVTLNEFGVVQENEAEYSMADFEVSCAANETSREQGTYRNCMPFRVSLILGDTECQGLEPPKTPDGRNPNPFYKLKEGSLVLRCGTGMCPRKMMDVMEEIVAPLGSACVEYYGYVDSVYPVCKIWKGKPKSLLHKGVLKDDNQDYVVAGAENTEFRFKDQQPDVDTSKIRGVRLTCGEDSAGTVSDIDTNVYKSNVRKLLENLAISLGAQKDPGSSLIKWFDRGSSLTDIQDESLKEVYKNIYGQGTLPVPCLTNCDSAEIREKPKIQMQVNWDEARSNCISRINDLCIGLCGGNAKSEATETFCRGMFPEPNTVSGGKGALRCECKEIDVQLESMSLAHTG